MICEYIKMKTDIKPKVTGSISNSPNISIKGTLYPFKGTMIARNEEVCDIEGRLETEYYRLNVNFPDESFVLKFWEKRTNIAEAASLIGMAHQMIKEKSADALYQMILPKVFDTNGNQIGEMQFFAENIGGLQSYQYRKVVINEVELTIYDVGVRKKGIHYCMYDSNNNMVATVVKRKKTTHSKSRYTMYIVNDEWYKYVALAVIMIHQQDYEKFKKDGEGLGSVSRSVYTYQKGLLEKYDPNFIPRIIAQDGVENLPENMPLVKKRVKQSYYTFGLIMERLGIILFIIIFVAILLSQFLGK